MLQLIGSVRAKETCPGCKGALVILAVPLMIQEDGETRSVVAPGLVCLVCHNAYQRVQSNLFLPPHLKN